jgi:hypothetical protein
MGYTHIRDAGHTVAMLIERVYGKSKIFKSFLKSVSLVKVRDVMRPTSYLLPPVQRTISRFMNLSGVIKWGKQVLKIFPTLNERERQTFDFVNKYRKLISELSTVFDCCNEILKILKNKGLSHKNIDLCLSKLQTNMKSKSKTVKQVRELISGYSEEEKKKLPEKTSHRNVSSDILESMFGTFKFRRSKNRLNGITAYVLMLPLLTEIKKSDNQSDINFKEALECVYMKDLKDWTRDNLTENLAVKRKNKLAG